MGRDGLTGFETEVVDSVLWQLEGYWAGRVTERATTRILRATLRRIKPVVAVRSVEAAASIARGLRNEVAVDHAIPLAIVVKELLGKRGLSRDELEKLLLARLVCVQITRHEHDVMLRQCGLRECMPPDWDLADAFARYKVAGITLSEVETAARPPRRRKLR